MSDFQFLMLSAMYENGGNVTHRLLDGHPHMNVYPFESQLGTNLVRDHLSGLFPAKYRWPVFSMSADSRADYQAIIDEECKIRARTPKVSKFRHMPFDFDDDVRCSCYETHIKKMGRSRANNVEAFFRATFDAWKDYRNGSGENVYVGYSPIVAVDGDKILDDFPRAHILHVVRNPWSAYADTKKRPVPLSIDHYMTAWVMSQYYALLHHTMCPERVHIRRYEDIIADPIAALGPICEKLGVPVNDSLTTPSWNGHPLEEVYPWGTILKANPDVNLETARRLSSEERVAVGLRASAFLAEFKYENLVE